MLPDRHAPPSRSEFSGLASGTPQVEGNVHLRVIYVPPLQATVMLETPVPEALINKEQYDLIRENGLLQISLLAVKA
jgi:hypothetical protein